MQTCVFDGLLSILWNNFHLLHGGVLTWYEMESCQSSISGCRKQKKFHPTSIEKASPTVRWNASTTQTKPRWGNKVGDVASIATKPWYMRSFEEVVEIECGEELRDEKYGKYNKSFVTKRKKSQHDPKETGIDCKEFEKWKEQPSIGSESLKSQVAEPRQDNKVQSRKLSKCMMVQDISIIDDLVSKELKKIDDNFHEVTKLRRNVEKSEDDVRTLQLRSVRAVTYSHSVVNSLLSARNSIESQKTMTLVGEWEKIQMGKLRNREPQEVEEMLATVGEDIVFSCNSIK